MTNAFIHMDIGISTSLFHFEIVSLTGISGSSTRATPNMPNVSSFFAKRIKTLTLLRTGDLIQPQSPAEVPVRNQTA
jgi:hypothetical protein